MGRLVPIFLPAPQLAAFSTPVQKELAAKKTVYDQEPESCEHSLPLRSYAPR